MDYRKDAVALAVLSLLGVAGIASADTASPKLSLEPTSLLADAPAPRAPLMAGLDAVGAAKTLDDLGINIYGYVQASYLYNPKYSNNQDNVGQLVTSGIQYNKTAFNAVDLVIERQVDLKKFDIGGKINILWGEDANGLYSTGEEGIQHGPNNTANGIANDDPSWAFAEYYVDVAIPVGNGLKVRVGKFGALAGYESTLNPAVNPFYTHSYIWGYAEYALNTGIVAFYNLNDQWAVAGGVIRGWGDSLEDKNDNGVTGIGQIAWTPSKQFQHYFNVTVGPEVGNDNDHSRVFFDYTGVYQATDRLSLGLNIDFYYDGGASANGDVNMGIATYAGYTINDYLTANARLEWFSDQADGAYAPATFNSGNNVNIWSITLGVTIKPLPKDPIGQNLKIRPEVRYDYAEDSIYSGGGSDGSRDQFLLGGDVIFTF